jgi:glycerol-3-phosphate acyltransferase PlsY
MNMQIVIAAIIIGYLLGSVPTGVWLGRIFKGIDIRKHGSKSIGATNVLRVLGARLAAVVLLIDIGKGFLSCYLAARLDPGSFSLEPAQTAMIAGLAAVLGHLFPVFAGFKGGKGIATGAGMLLYLAPLELAFALVIFIITVAITRYVSLGSLLAAAFFSISIFIETYWLKYPLGGEMSILAILLIILTVYTHRANIGRLINGTENRLGRRGGES